MENTPGEWVNAQHFKMLSLTPPLTALPKRKTIIFLYVLSGGYKWIRNETKVSSYKIQSSARAQKKTPPVSPGAFFPID
jgi:hypothetical protein